MSVSLLYPENYSPKEREIHRMKDFSFIDTLSISSMIIIGNDSFRGLPVLHLEDFFTTDTRVISYRLDIIEELLEDNGICSMFNEAIPVIRNIFDMHKALSSDFSVDTALSSIRILENYVEITDKFYDVLKKLTPVSDGLKALRDTIIGIAESEEYKNLRSDMDNVETDFGTLKSITIGVNLDENLQVEEAGIVSINRTQFHSGTIIDRITHRNDKDPSALTTMLYPLHRGLASGDSAALAKSVRYALQTIYSQGIKSFEPIIQKYFAVNTSVFVQLFGDLRFLTACVSFIKEMKSRGMDMVKPGIADISEKRCSLKGVYNVNLARSEVEAHIVANDFEFDDNGRFYILTGPNHGGKSIFAYSVGMAQALFQLGCYVPASYAVISPVTGIFTHFPSSDDGNYGKGRLESECDRLSRILKQLGDTDMLIMDESFSSTSAMEAGYIAGEVLTGIGAIGCGGIFVTHIHDLCEQVSSINAYPKNRAKIDNLAAVMENVSDGTRSYHVARIKPDGLSYARDIAARYGLDYTTDGHF